MGFRPGFAPRWTDEADYILGITYDIWEGRRVAALRDWYADDLIVRSPASVVQGNGGIIGATLATLAEFPDRQLFGEDVIWCEAGEDAFLSSHRLLCTATHSGAGAYGAPTGTRLRYRILADCFCRADQVADEWLVRDQGAIVRQMGQTPENWTRTLIAREGGPEACVQPLTPRTDVTGPYSGTGNDHPMGLRLADIIRDAMAGTAAVFEREWDRAASVHYWSHAEDHGPTAAAAHWTALRAAFPSAEFTLQHTMGAAPNRAALRWSLQGRHDGAGLFGPATGADVYVMGITHAEFGPWGLRREWTLIDETAIWKQILLATGAC